MRLVFGGMAQSKSIGDEVNLDGWTRLKEPQSFLGAFMISLPIAAILMFLEVIFLTSSVIGYEFQVNLERIEITIDFVSFAVFIISLYLLMIFHELLHMILIPNFVSSDKTIMGFNWYGAYVITSEEIAISRFYLISVFPYLVISVIGPLIIGSIFGLNNILVTLFILNGASSCIDILNIIITKFQVPRNSVITMRGMETYYKGEGNRKQT